MPRPNRYHPYTRNGTSPPMMSSRLVHPPHTLQYSTATPSSTSSPSPSLSSHTIPTLAQPQSHTHNLAQAHVLPTISERAPIPNFKHVPTTYIHAQTSDGKDLVPRSILQGPDGTFHVQMQVVRFPSEVKSPAGRLPPPSPLMLDPRLDAVRAASANAGAGTQTWYDANAGQRPPTPYMGPGMGMGMGFPANTNMNMGMGMNMSLDVQLPRKSSGASDSGYSDGKSERMDDECAVFSEDDEEDAEGEEDEGDYERDLKELVEQQRIMINVVKERGYGMVNAGLPA